MRVLLKTILLTILFVALVAVIVNRQQLAALAPLGPELAILIIAGVAGFILAWPRRAPATGESTGLALTGDAASTSSVPEPLHDRALLSFAQQLLASSTAQDRRATIESQFPVMLQGRRVWIVWEGQARESTSAAPGFRHVPTLTEPVQEWTTFALQLNGERHGLLGVESAGGLSSDLKLRIQALTPLIAQSLKTAQEIDAFREASVIDPLTGATTRREGLSRVQAEIKRAQRTDSTMAVLMMDLDHFKSINDRFGHAVGDALLTAIGETMVRTLRATDVRCRWGGEEFLIVLPDTTLAQAQVVATHLLNNVAATSVPTAKGPISSTASLGLTIARPAETDVDRIISRADMALYQAKNAGRSCIRVVLGGFDGEPVGMEAPKRGTPPQGDQPGADQLPFPDRRSPDRRDRRAVPGPGRRRTDAGPGPKSFNSNEGPSTELKVAGG